MTDVEFFKLQSKNFYKDVKTIYLDKEYGYDFKPKYFEDIYNILYDWEFYPSQIGDGTIKFSLMKAQHVIAQIVGCRNWSDLINSSKEKLELKRSLLEHIDKMFYNGSWEEPFIQSWLDYERLYLKGFDDFTKLQIYKYTFLKNKTVLN